MNIYCILGYCPSVDKMLYSDDRKNTCHFLCLYSFWALRICSRDLELCLLKWQTYTIQVLSYDRCMKERKSCRSRWQHWCQQRWLEVQMFLPEPLWWKCAPDEQLPSSLSRQIRCAEIAATQSTERKEQISTISAVKHRKMCFPL